MFKGFGRAETLADGFIWGVACARAGIPTLLVAPPSGGKSTIIDACKKWLGMNNYKTLEVSRIGLRTLKGVASYLIRNKEVVLFNDDYSNIGDSDYMVVKMGEIISALSYSGGFYDYGLNIKITMKKLGFISGVQPLWINTLMSSRVFSTNIREKFIRYYLLPHRPTPDLEYEEAIKLLVENQPTYRQSGEIKIPSIFLDSLALQVGRTRGKEFANRLVEELKALVPLWKIPKLLRFFSTRIGLENIIVERELGEYTYNVDVYWKAYTVLYWCLRKGGVEKEDFKEYLGVSSIRSVERALDEALTKGFVVMTPTRNLRVLPNYNVFKGGME
jgi:hypothetical protein